MSPYKLSFFLVFSAWTILSPAANIKGRINMDETWAPVVYLSVIQSFDDLHTASYDFLRYQAELDSTGYFEFYNLDLADDDRIYRFHICKKGDPVSTIMIGGQEENFIHFIMNKESDILLLQNEDLPGLQYCKVQGHSAGASLTYLFDLQKKLNTPPDLPSAQNRAFIKNQVMNDFSVMADSSSNEVIRLLAISFINESFTNIDHLELMEKVQNDLTASGYSSPYYESFSKQLSFLQFQAGKTTSPGYSWLKWFSLALLLPLIVLFLWREIKRRPVKRKKESNQIVRSLSMQEKRVFNLLKNGKSNKEISSELHIEVSTVKSHLHKIYSRLGVKSRKEIVDREW